MKQGMRAMAGAVALVGLLATAGPAMAKDRVIAVDGVSKTNADRRVEILVHVPEGAERERRRRPRAGGAGREEGAAAGAAAEPLLVHRACSGTCCRSRRTTTRPARGARRAQTALDEHATRTGAASRAPNYRIQFGGTTSAARRWSASARARRRTTASTTSAGRSSPTARSA